MSIATYFQGFLCLLPFACAAPLFADDPIAETLETIAYRNAGVVTRDMEFVDVQHDSHYNETYDKWFTKKFAYRYEPAL